MFEKRGPVHMKGRVEPMITYFLTRDPKYEPRIPVTKLEDTNSFGQWSAPSNGTSKHEASPEITLNVPASRCPFAVSEIPAFEKITQV